MRNAAAALLVAVVVTGCDSSTDRTAPPAPSPAASATRSPLPTTPPGPDDPLSPQPAVESPAPKGQPTCHPKDLTVTDADQYDVEEGVHEVFLLRTGGAPCQLEGWPAVSFLDESGNRLPLTPRHGGYGLPDDPPAVVTLNRGTSLSFLVGTGRSRGCRQAATVVVTLPGTTQPLRAPTTLQLCGSVFGVSPVQRLADEE